MTSADVTVCQAELDPLPRHTQFDGDTIFALSTGSKKADVSTIGAYAAEAMATAIVRAVTMAKPAGGLPGLKQE